MRLRGTKTEQDFRQELLKSRQLFTSPSALRKVIESSGHPSELAYVLHWTPEQCEDIYLILVNGAYLLRVEISKSEPGESSIIEKIELEEYLRGLSKMNRIRLMVAQELINQNV